jgi:imidazolonepropionase-like amidohydrolase
MMSWLRFLRGPSDVRKDLMTSKTRAFLLFLIAASLVCSCRKLEASRTIAITHVTVINADDSSPQADMTVLVQKQRIVAVSPSVSTSIPWNAQVVDATGKFAIPGLVDAHVHLTGSGEPEGSREFMIPLLLANGITTVRDMGGYLESLLPLRREIAEGKRVGPTIFFAGPYLDGNPPSFQPSLVVTNAAQADEDVQTLVERGVDFIKVQSILSREAYFAIAAAAHREHIVFVGHVPDRVTAAEASDAGQKSIEHLTGVLRACSHDEPALMREQFRAAPKKETPKESQARAAAWERSLLASYSEEKAAELIAKFRRNGTWQAPTLVLLRNDAFPGPDTDPAAEAVLRYVPRTIAQKWKEARLEQSRFATSTEFALREKLLAQSMRMVGQMQAAGVGVMAGTDTAAPYVVPGFALHEELELFVQAGLTPKQALRAATKSPADFLGESERNGSIAAGRAADLVLLGANPLEDIRNAEKIEAVVVRGSFLDRSALDNLRKSVEKFAAEH